MNILFIFARHSENPTDSTLTKDLSDEFARQGNKVTVVTLLEKELNKKTQLKIENGYEVLRVKTKNYFNVGNPIKKGMSVFCIPSDLKKGILAKFRERKFDLIITHTPFVSSEKLIEPLKKYFQCPAHLILWDIFPQNAKDIGIIRNAILFSFFKRKEKKMLIAYDYIWCMSKGNINYMENNYNYLNKERLGVLRNWAMIKSKFEKRDLELTKKKYPLFFKGFTAVFGGNMGKPQKIENLLALAKRCQQYHDITFLFVGSGSEKKRLEVLSKKEGLGNVFFLNQIHREEYELFISCCDIGLISLDERFTVPNFPSKTTDYLKCSLPILASLDECSKQDYGIFLERELKAGFFAPANNTDRLYEKLVLLYQNKDLRKKLGKNGRKYYEQFLGVEIAYKTIMDKVGESNERYF